MRKHCTKWHSLSPTWSLRRKIHEHTTCTEIVQRVQRKTYRRSSRIAQCVCIRTMLVIAHVTANLINPFGWDVITHPSYSPDVVLSDYHLFPEIKKHLGRTHMCVQIFFAGHAKDRYTKIYNFYDTGKWWRICHLSLCDEVYLHPKTMIVQILTVIIIIEISRH